MRHRLTLDKGKPARRNVDVAIKMVPAPAVGKASTVTVETPVVEEIKPMTITKEVNSPVQPGDTATFTVTVTANKALEEVSVTDLLPAGYEFMAAVPTAGSASNVPVDDISNFLIMWTIGSMTAGQSETLTITAEVLEEGPYLNAATATCVVDGKPVSISAAAKPVVSASEVSLPAGSDSWYDSGANANIPFQAYDGALSEITDASAFGTDDDFDGEEDLPGIPVSPPLASAWWQITTPADKGGTLTVDTWRSTGGQQNFDESPAVYKTDTNLSIWKSPVAPPLGPLPIRDDPIVDFTTLELVASSDDAPDPEDADRPYTSKLEDVVLEANSVYWIRVDTWGGDAAPGSMYFDGIQYQLQLTLVPDP